MASFLFTPLSPFDGSANDYIVSTYQIGFSIKLIDKRLIEYNYDSTESKVEEVLMQAGISPNGYNCSQDSQTWKRYLTYIIETYKPATEDQFEVNAHEYNSIYGISLETAKTFYREYKAFQDEFTQVVMQRNPLEKLRSSDLLPRAFHVFGSNCEFLRSNFLARRLLIPVVQFMPIYHAQIALNPNLYYSSPMLAPRQGPTDTNTLSFWRAGRALRMDLDRVAVDTKIFTGWDTTEDDIMVESLRSFWRGGGSI